MVCEKVTSKLREMESEKERAVPWAALNLHLFPILIHTNNKPLL